MAKYSKRRRSRRGSKRKGRGGTVGNSITNAAISFKEGVGNAGDHMTDAAKKLGDATTGLATDSTKAMSSFAGKLGADVDKAASGVTSGVEQSAKSVSSTVGNITHGVMTGGRRGGSGRCCFPAKFCGSRKRKGNKRRSIRTGRCCLPVKSKKCGAKKKNGRKTKKNKRKRKSGMFNMFGGG